MPETSTHDAEADARNDDLKIYVNGEIVHRDQAVVSVYDSGFLLGDGVWEGIRLYMANGPSWAPISTGCSRLPRPSIWISAWTGRGGRRRSTPPPPPTP